MSFVVILIVGLVAGALARVIFPGRQSMGLVGTTLLGIAGSFVGGAVGSALQAGEPTFATSGVLWSTLGALLVLAVVNVAGRRMGA